MAYSIEVKNEVQERLKKGEESVQEISQQTGVGLSTIYRWKKEIAVQNVKEERNVQEISKKIKRLTSFNEFEAALKLTDMYPDKDIIQLQRMKILIIQGKYQEAKEVGNRECFINNPIFQDLMKKIETIEETLDTKREPVNKNLRKTEGTQTIIKGLENQNSKIKQQFLNRMKTKIYYNKISPEDIEEIKSNTEISEYERNCILLAIHEKQRNIQKVRQLVKNYRTENPESKDNKTFNIIMQRAENKKAKIFDYRFYDDLLLWKIDKELKEKYEQECKEESNRKRELKKQNEATIISMPKAKSDSTSQEKKANNYAKNQERSRNFREGMKVRQVNDTKVLEQEKTREEPNHFKEILEYLEEKRRFIYVKAQSRDYKVQREGISQWDRMEVLLEKVKENRDNKEYLNPLYEKILRLKAKERKISREEI